MPQPAHQLGQRGAGLGGQYRAGVPQVVEVQTRVAGDRARLVEVRATPPLDDPIG